MTTIKDAFPQDLIDIFNSLDFQECGGLVITQLTYLSDNLNLNFKIAYDDKEVSEQSWTINISGLVKEKIETDWSSELEMYSDHPLLYEFTDFYTELYFNGIAKNPEKLFVDLYKSHVATFGKYLEFGLCINAPHGLFKLCTNDSGLFARGPFKVLEKYTACLKTHDIQTNYLNSKESDTPDLKLLIFGDSYFIANDFLFSRTA